MTLESPRLDDLTWEDLRLLAQRRIPAASSGRWTLHGPVDPGVTFLELFAFLLEQQVFVLDQVPDSLGLALLALLGEAPEAAGVARTVVTFRPDTPWALASPPPTVRAGTVILPADAELGGLRFTLQQEVTPLRVASTATEGFLIEVNGVARGSELIRGHPVALTAGPGAPLRVDLLVALLQPLPAAPASARVTVLLDLAATGGVPPHWDADAVSVDPPTEIEFFYVDDAGGEHAIDVELGDGSGGLRRSGVLSLRWPDELVGEQILRLRLRAPRTHFSAPPQLRALALNAAIAHHRAPIRLLSMDPGTGPREAAREAVAAQIRDWLPHSGLELLLPRELGTPLADTVELELRHRDGTRRLWTRVLDLVFSGPQSPVFTVDRERRRLHFGDGYAGRVPAPATDFELRLEVGGGPEGNLGTDIDWIGEDASGPEYTIRNPIPARGGGEPETVESARLRAAASLDRRYRAVTQDDFVTLVETTRGIRRHRAHVAVGHHPDLPCAYVPDAVTVFAIPRIDRQAALVDAAADLEVRAPRPDPGALGTIDARLQDARLLTTQVFVRVPRYRAAALVVTVAGDPPDPAAFADIVRRSLARHLDAVIGGNEREGWPFGHPLRPSELVRVAQDALHDRSLVQSVAVGIDGAATEEDCQDTPIGPHDLVFLESCRVVLRREAAAGGVL